jgi:hypothetical protein
MKTSCCPSASELLVSFAALIFFSIDQSCMEEPDDGARQRAAVALAVAVPEVSLHPGLLENGLYVDRDNFFRNIL